MSAGSSDGMSAFINTCLYRVLQGANIIILVSRQTTSSSDTSPLLPHCTQTTKPWIYSLLGPWIFDDETLFGDETLDIWCRDPGYLVQRSWIFDVETLDIWCRDPGYLMWRPWIFGAETLDIWCRDPGYLVQRPWIFGLETLDI